MGRPVYLRDLVDIVRGYEDPPGVMNFQTIKADADHPSEAKMPGEAAFLQEDEVKKTAPQECQAANHSRPSRSGCGRSKVRTSTISPAT